LDRSQFAQESSKPQVQVDANVFFRHAIGFSAVNRNENLLNTKYLLALYRFCFTFKASKKGKVWFVCGNLRGKNWTSRAKQSVGVKKINVTYSLL